MTGCDRIDAFLLEIADENSFNIDLDVKCKVIKTLINCSHYQHLVI